MKLAAATQLAASVVAGNIGGAFTPHICIAPGPLGTTVSGVAPDLRIKIEVERPPPRLTPLWVDGKHVADVLSKLGEESVEVEKGVLVVSVGKSRVRMPVLDAGLDFGADSLGEPFEVDAATLLRALTATLSPATTSGQPHLQGVLFDGDRIASTDGHRMHVAPCAGLPTCVSAVPLAAVQAIIRTLESEATDGAVKIIATATEMRIAVARAALRFPLLSAPFPPYRQVLPKSHSAELTCSGKALADAFKVARMGQVVTNAKATKEREEPGIIMSVKGGDLDLHSETEASDAACPCTGTMAEPLMVKAPYVLDAIAALGSDEVTLWTAKRTNKDFPEALEFRNGETIVIVMPRRM